MAKRVKSYDWLCGYNVLFGEWLTPDDIDLYSKIPNAEKVVIKKELWNQLSAEAKEVIEIILFAPTEVLDQLRTPERKLLTKGSIKRYFRRHWNSKAISDLVIKEITRWVNQL